MRFRSLVMAYVFVAMVLPVRAAQAQSPHASDRAREAYHRGQSLFDAHRYSDALQAFRESLGLLDSPNTRLYIARALREMDHPVDAWFEFDRAAHDAAARSTSDPRYRDTRVNALAERDALTPRIAFARVVIAPGVDASQIIVNGHPISSEDLGRNLPVAPGVVQVTVHTTGGAEITRVADLAPGSVHEIEIAPSSVPPPPLPRSSPPRPLRIGGIVAAGVGILALAGGAIAGGLDAAQYQQLQQVCGNAPCSPAYSSAVSRGETEQLVANVLFVTGGIALAAGVAMLAVDLFGHRARMQAAPTVTGAMMRIEF